MNRSKKVVRLGMDIGKNTFHLFGVDETGLPVVKKKLRRKQVLTWFANLPACLVAMEACGGSHYWAREIGKHRGAGEDSGGAGGAWVASGAKTRQLIFV